jgi:hypothetical protein
LAAYYLASQGGEPERSDLELCWFVAQMQSYCADLAQGWIAIANSAFVWCTMFFGSIDVVCTSSMFDGIVPAEWSGDGNHVENWLTFSRNLRGARRGELHGG